MRTIRTVTMRYGKGGIQYDITIPAGTRVAPAGNGEYFVDDLSWIEDRRSMLMHDATYYGIRVKASDVLESA